MSETLLEALMQLFALLTDIRKERQTGRAYSRVKDFLSRQFSSEYVDQYLGRFEVYLNRYHSEVGSNNQELKDKQSSDNLNRILNIATKINTELEQEPKIVLFSQLLDFLKKDEEIRDDEIRLVDLLADCFKIEPSDYQNLKAFILKEPLEVPNKSELLLITGEKEDINPEIKILYNPPQQVTVWVLHVKSTNTFIFRYSGKETFISTDIKLRPTGLIRLPLVR